MFHRSDAVKDVERRMLPFTIALDHDLEPFPQDLLPLLARCHPGVRIILHDLDILRM
jgi:hypothetical protein